MPEDKPPENEDRDSTPMESASEMLASQVEGAGVPPVVELDEAYKVYKCRICVGYALMICSAFALGTLLNCALTHLPSPEGHNGDTAWMLVLAAHGVITVSAAWFCYQVLRAGERMAVPLWIDSEKAKVAYGIRGPHREVFKVLQKMLDQLLKSKN